LMVATWVALWVANRLALPISNLISASERVRAGDLSIRVDESHPYDDLVTLSKSFNRMTHQLDSQRRDLMNVNLQLDERRRFTETVLAGVTSGVMSVDHDGVIVLANNAAARLLSRPL